MGRSISSGMLTSLLLPHRRMSLTFPALVLCAMNCRVESVPPCHEGCRLGASILTSPAKDLATICTPNRLMHHYGLRASKDTSPYRFIGCNSQAKLQGVGGCPTSRLHFDKVSHRK